ncbi:MAG: methyltransferase domain-containing protein [Caldilineaceae bacterium]|nr:methyltransferase domain-containing protein [Caldilineaceae bacterium]
MQTSKSDGQIIAPHDANPRAAPVLDLPENLPNRPTRLLLVSHAESLQRRYGNLTLTDTGLTAVGWEQSNALAEWLRTHEQVDHLISSPQLRCRLTAQRVSQSLGIPVVLESIFPVSPRRDWLLQVPTGNGSAEQQTELAEYQVYYAKVIEAFNHILGSRWGENIVVVVNPNAVAVILRHLNGGRLGITVEDTGISELILVDRRWQLLYFNRREHLPRPILNSAKIRTETPVDSDVRDQVAVARQLYNQLAANITLEELHERAHTINAPDKEFIRFAEIGEGQRLLEVGSGLGVMTLALAKTGALEVVGVDVSPAMLERAEYLRLSTDDADMLRRVSYRLGPAHDLPFPGNSFDVVICRFLLHHIVKLDRTLLEFQRVLKPNGILLVAELAGSEDAVKRATQNAIEGKRNPSHAMIRTVEQYREHLGAVGFVLERERMVKKERRLKNWLDEVIADKQTRHAVTEMLEASIETDAAELNVHRQNDDLIFEHRVVYLAARKAE